jgi:hypothetical protein
MVLGRASIMRGVRCAPAAQTLNVVTTIIMVGAGLGCISSGISHFVTF